MLPESEIGQNIRQIRRSKGLTLDALARQTGFSKGYLSKVENSDKAPPVSTLINIAGTLGVTLTEIFGEPGRTVSFSLVKKKDRQLMARDRSAFGYSYEPLAHEYPHKRMEPYIVTVPAKPVKGPLLQHQGEELLLVLKGAFNFRHGENEYRVEEGDCIYFDSGIPHAGCPVGDQEVKCLIVIFTP